MRLFSFRKKMIHICDPDDKEAMDRFADAMRNLGARPVDHAWGMGVDLLWFKIGWQKIIMVSDTWSVDIYGPQRLVREVLQEFRRLRSKPGAPTSGSATPPPA